MKLLNKKGFVLIETLIVAVFVVTLFIFVYQNIVPFIGEYETMTSYDDIDSVYASNIFKQTLLRYGKLDYIDSYLENHSYIDITNCNDTKIYNNADYCKKIKNSLNILDQDYIFLSNYDISRFRDEVNSNEWFDSGKLSNFKSYIHTVPNIDSFYNPSDSSRTLNGKYRLFMTRTVTNSDQSTSIKYTNIGIFMGNYQQYYAGDMVTFDPGDGNKNFYVLKNSTTTEDKVTLILANNLTGTTAFRSASTNSIPNTVLDSLKQKTNSWGNVPVLTTADQFVSKNGYTISYSGYHARLLDENDLYILLGCSKNQECFRPGDLFTYPLDNRLEWLSSNLTGNNGYWTANSVVGDETMAWSIQKDKLIPVAITENTSIGIRPVITVLKEKLK